MLLTETIKTATPYDGPANELDGDLKKLFQKTHLTIKKVSNDIEERFHFNTAISAVMELVNMMYSLDLESARQTSAGSGVIRTAVESVILLMSPIIPHVAGELWETLGNENGSLAATPWPSFREDALISDTCLVIAQVNGKLRGKFNIDANADDETIKETALADENVRRFIDDRPIKKIIVVKKKLVNIVI